MLNITIWFQHAGIKAIDALEFPIQITVAISTLGLGCHTAGMIVQGYWSLRVAGFALESG